MILCIQLKLIKNILLNFRNLVLFKNSKSLHTDQHSAYSGPADVRIVTSLLVPHSTENPSPDAPNPFCTATATLWPALPLPPPGDQEVGRGVSGGQLLSVDTFCSVGNSCTKLRHTHSGMHCTQDIGEFPFVFCAVQANTARVK